MGSKRDIRNQLKAEIALEPQLIDSDTTTTGAIIDTADYDGGVMFTQFMTYTDGDFTPLIEESDASDFGSGVTAVDDANLIGDVATGQEADSKLEDGVLITTIGVVNNLKRYLRYKIVSANTSSGSVVAAVAHKKGEVLPVV